MKAGEKEGLGAALELVEDRVLDDDPALAARLAHQLALWPTPAAVVQANGSDEVAQRRGPGRPAGSRNKRTKEWADWILGQYKSPLVFLAETYARPVEMLARELGCKRKEAHALQQTAAKELLPYIHQKQPVSVEIDGRLVHLTIHTSAPGGPAVAAPEGAVTIEGKVIDNEENQ